MAEKDEATSVVKPIKRQAVVVVHGQGQQRPMGTIRDFVEVLWSANPHVNPDPNVSRETWIVPDDKAGLYELQRITTPEHGGRRTDFYELYYADLLADTPVRNLWRWMQRLLWINPHEVTGRMRWPWIAFWILNVITGLFALWVVLEIPQLLKWDWRAPFLEPDPWNAWLGLAIIVVALAALIPPKFFPYPDHTQAAPKILVVAAIIVGAAFIYLFNGGVVLIGAALLAYVLYLASDTLLPLFGDAASYLSAQTDTVRSRQALRERGLKLLRALHDDGEYDRIVIVAHSLGTVLAYDLLQLLWHNVGPTKDNPPEPDAVKALEAVRDFAKKPKPSWKDGGIAQYQNLQWAAFTALRQQKPVLKANGTLAKQGGWKVSDFVSLGSPLASAQFLITEGKADFERMKRERVLPTSPPQPRDTAQGFLYDEEEKKHWVTHHASVFSAVRWTNIYDEFDPVFFYRGDAIGGPIASDDVFGPGISDVKVTIKRNGKRVFSHNLYWVDTIAEKPSGKPQPEEATSQDRAPVRREEAAEQIRHLRNAVGMQRD